ncbi:MAG: hypothetical protein KDK70_09200 [Myxococcales bacterium]|nr:hypothetical protein [Myxococcales bacterium]
MTPASEDSARLPRGLGALALGLVGLAVVVHGLRPIIDLDLWWHMRLGELLLAGEPDTRVDVFSHTQAGTPWVWKDWGSAILFHGLWVLGGPWAIIVAKALAFAGTAALAWRLVRSDPEVPPALALVVVSATLAAAQFRFTERASSISLLLLLAVLVLIERDRRGARGLAWVIPLTLLNANLHRAALLLPVVMGAYAAVCLLEARLGRDRDWRRPALVAAGTGLACLVTPYGLAIVTTTVALMGEHSPLITEWAPVSLALVLALTPASLVVMGLAAAGAGLGQWKRRPWDPWDLALIAMAFGLGLGSMRHLPLLAVLGAGPAARGLAVLHRAWTGRLQGLVAVAAPAALVAYTLTRPIALPGPALAPAHYPERGLAFVQGLPEALHPRGALFNEFGFGGQLIFHLWPRHRVYIDGRTDLVYPAAFVEHYVRCLHDPRALAQEAEARDLQWIFLDNVPFDRGRLHLDLDPAWTLVHASRRALVYVRTRGINAALAADRGYRLLHAHDLPGSLRAAAARGQGDAALAELRRMLDDDPDNPYALAALAQLAPPDPGADAP